MAIVRKTLLLAAAAAGLWIGPLSSAQADAFAQSILVIDNFRLLHASGTPLGGGASTLSAPGHAAGALAVLDNTSLGGAVQSGNHHGNNPDVLQQFLGVSSVSPKENDFVPFSPQDGVPGTFGYADQYLQSSAAGAVPGAAATQALASLKDKGRSAGVAGIESSLSFNFTLGVGDAVTIAFDGTPFTQAYLQGAPGDVAARLSWRLDIMNLNTGELVFAYQPGELNEMGHVNRSDSFSGLATYNPGTLSFLAQTPFLNNSDTYQLAIHHNTMAYAIQGAMAVPEPDNLALFGLALLAMAVCKRRRRARAPDPMVSWKF